MPDLKSKLKSGQPTAKKKADAPQLSEADLIKKKLHHVAVSPRVRYWLDTGNPGLNGALGSRTRGLAYGRIYELSGPKSQGKSLVTFDIGAMAQKDGAEVAWMPLEEPFDEEWSYKRGLDPTRVSVFESRPIQKKGDKHPRLIRAEELCDEADEWMHRTWEKNPKGKMFLAVDSVAAMLVDVEAEAGLDGQNMRTNVALAMFLGKLMRRWVGMAMAYNVMIFLVNQIRTKPGVMFGNPDYTVGGNPIGFYAASRAYLYRLGGGALKDGKQQLGFRGVIRNEKNKIGGGSVELQRAAFVHRYGYKTKYIDYETVLAQRAKEQRGMRDGGDES